MEQRPKGDSTHNTTNATRRIKPGERDQTSSLVAFNNRRHVWRFVHLPPMDSSETPWDTHAPPSYQGSFYGSSFLVPHAIAIIIIIPHKPTHKGEKPALQQQSRVHSHLLSQHNSKLPRVPRIHSLRQRGFAFWTTNLPCSHPRSDQPTKNKAQEIRFPLSDPSLSLSFYKPTRIPTIHHLSLIHCRSTKRRQTKRKAHSFLVPNYCLVRVAGTPISLQL